MKNIKAYYNKPKIKGKKIKFNMFYSGFPIAGYDDLNRYLASCYTFDCSPCPGCGQDCAC